MDKFLNAAIQEAKMGLEEGGIPIGSVLVIDDEIVGGTLRHLLILLLVDDAARLAMDS